LGEAFHVASPCVHLLALLILQGIPEGLVDKVLTQHFGELCHLPYLLLDYSDRQIIQASSTIDQTLNSIQRTMKWKLKISELDHY
jgi:hypothetical protein